MNNGFGKIFLIIFLLSMFGGILPVLIPILIVFWVLNSVVKSGNKKATRTYNYNRNQNGSADPRSYNYNRNTVKEKKYSTEKVNQLDVKLRQYFSDHFRMPVCDDFVLIPSSGRYKYVYDLNVYEGTIFRGDLKSFATRSPEQYNRIMDVLMDFVQSGDIIEAEVVNERPQQEKTATTQTGRKTGKAKTQEKTYPTEAEKYMEQLNDLNIAIPDENISNGLYECCALLKQISEMEQKFPNKKARLEKLYEHYLPILVRILTQYRDLLSFQTNPEFKKCEDQLASFLPMINKAMRETISMSFDEDFLNLSADISTLEALLKQDGLAGDDILNYRPKANPEEVSKSEAK